MEIFIILTYNRLNVKWWTSANPQDTCMVLIIISFKDAFHINCKISDEKSDRIKILDKNISNIHRLVNHITNHDLPHLRHRVRELEDNRLLRVEYINKKRSKEDLAMAVYRNDIQRKKTIDILQIDELLSVVGIENFTNLYNSKLTGLSFLDQIDQFIADYSNLISYTNREMKLISITYNHNVMIINQYDFDWANKKYVKSQLDAVLKSNTCATGTCATETSATGGGAGCSTDPI